MTREELKKHCLKQVEACEMWAKHNGEEPHGKVYEEHKLILELLEQEPCEDCISKKAVLDKINEICFSREQEAVDFRVAQGSNGQRDLIINFIKNLASVQSKPKTGYWNTYEITQGGINEEWIECSECMWSNALVIPRNYCPNCGCKMDVIGDDNRRSN